MPSDFYFTFTWRHLIDILVISFILHRIFLLLRGSAAFQMLLGLVFLLLLQAAAQMAGLVLTSWFFRGLGAFALLAIVVLFRREIRELLIQTNPMRFFLGRPPSEPLQELEPLIASVFKLAQSKTGALIVLQNRDPLSQRLHDGFELDGRLIPQILETLFAKESPLHDGAVVIAGDRIRWVGTFLPLSTRERLPKRFGTRHRAAIGLSEVTDAIVLLVSEERGEVALVENGNVRLMRTPQHLRHHLLRRMARRTANVDSGIRVRAWLAKVAGFALIFLLVSSFWGIYFGRQSLIQVSAPIDFRNIPEGVILRSSSSEHVNVQISGNRILINDLKAQDVRVFVNLSGFGEGLHTVAIKDDNVELPTGLAVARLSPGQVAVELDKLVRKRVKVQPMLVGSLPSGLRIARIQTEPEVVVVSGPSAELLQEDVLYTTPIDLNRMPPDLKRFALKLPVAFPHASIKMIDPKDGLVRVSIALSDETFLRD